jgi:C terminal of Calcineurin-like phosphoesterase/N terminal of Calcineurin-like phosphoesterase/Calcineurin-like phosphoesterase
MRKIITSFFLFLVTSFLIAQTSKILVSGVVFKDENRNGVKEDSETGIKNVPVSNGQEIVITDKKGRYTINATAGNTIFPILPSDYIFSDRNMKNLNACFLYLKIKDHSLKDSTLSANFPLISQKVPKTFRIAAVGDVQMENDQEINYANQTIMAELMDRNDLSFNVFLGDLVNDEPQLLPVVRDMISQLPVSSWTVFGNHDRLTKSELPQNAIFNENFGADVYAFNYGHVHFLILNTVFPKGKLGYEGRLSERQLQFITNDLKLLPKNQLLVICQHIPILFTENKNELFERLKGFRNVLALSGHTHTVSRVFSSEKDLFIQELIAGSSCGNWWTGEKNEQGIPSALMQCGSPRNYFTVDFNQNTYKLNFKGIGLDENKQMDIWVNGQDTLDHQIDAFSTLPANEVVANIFGGSDSTEVYIQIDKTPFIKMEKVKMVSPNVSRIISLNKTEIYPTHISSKGALRKQTSTHIWSATLPDNLVSGIHSIKIVAKDKYGFDVNGFRLVLIP